MALIAQSFSLISMHNSTQASYQELQVHEIINKKTPSEFFRLEQLKDIIKLYPKGVDAIDPNGLPALHAAVKNNHCTIVRFLIEQGAHHLSVDTYGKTALSYADDTEKGKSIKAYLNLVNDFYKTLEDPDYFNIFAGTHLTTQEALITVRKLITLDVKKKITALFGAYCYFWDKFQKKQLFKILDDNDTDEDEKIAQLRTFLTIYPYGLQVKNCCALTPLHYAFWREYKSIILFLLKRGSNINEPDDEGATMLHWASYCGRDDLVEFILAKEFEYNLKINAQTKNEKRTALHLAIKRGHTLVIGQLIAAGANLNKKDFKGKTPLYFACSKNDSKTCKILIHCGANPLLPTNEGVDLLDCCKKKEVSQKLLQYITLVTELHQTINNPGTFTTFAEKHLTTKAAIKTVHDLLHLDKKNTFKKAFIKWKKKTEKKARKNINFKNVTASTSLLQSNIAIKNTSSAYHNNFSIVKKILTPLSTLLHTKNK